MLMARQQHTHVMGKSNKLAMRLHALPLVNAILAVFTVGLCWGIIIPVTSVILEGNGIPTPLIGFTATAIFIGMAVSSPFVGRWIERFGIKPVVFAGLSGSGVLMIILALFTSVPLWIAFRFVLGITFSAVIISSEILINRVSTEDNRGRNLGLYAFAFSFSLMVTPLALWLLKFGLGVPFIIGGAVCLIASFLITLTMPGMQEVPSALPPALRLFQRISLSLVTNCVAGFMEGALIALIPLYTLREGFDEAQTGILIFAFLLGHGGGPPFIGILADRLGLRRILGLVYGLGTAAFMFILICPLRMGLAFPLLLAGMSVGALYPLAVGLIGERLQSSELPRGNAMITSAYGVGSILGPVVPALIMHVSVPQSLFIIAAVIYTAVLLVMRLQKHYYSERL